MPRTLQRADQQLVDEIVAEWKRHPRLVQACPLLFHSLCPSTNGSVGPPGRRWVHHPSQLPVLAEQRRDSQGRGGERRGLTNFSTAHICACLRAKVAIGALAACGDRRLADGTLAAAALQFYKANNAAPSPDVGNSHEDLELWAKKQGAGARRLASRLKNCMGHTPEKSKSSKLQEVKAAMLQRFEEKGMIEPLSANAPDLQASASKPHEDFDWDALADMLPKPVSEDLIPPGKAGVAI